MNLGAAFSSHTVNPLYDPAAPGRVTVSELRSLGAYLAARIDAPTLAGAKAIVDAGAAVSALDELPDADTLYCDDATYRASLAAQKLRILTGALSAPHTADAFVWGDTDQPTFGAGGSRVIFADTSADAADTLRATTSAVAIGLITGGYACGIGSADAAEAVDVETFLEALRAGATLPEAAAQALAFVDGCTVVAGRPDLTVSFQTEGYNLYRGVGDISGVDFDTPVAMLRRDATSASVAGLAHAVSAEYTYVLRPVRGSDALETPDQSCRMPFETDGDGDWIGVRPAAVDFIEANVIAGGGVEIRWGYTTPYGASSPAEFCIYSSDSPDIAPGSPDATVGYTGDTTYSTELTFDDGATRYLAVTARSSGGVESALSEILGPFVAVDSEPEAPTVYAQAVF